MLALPLSAAFPLRTQLAVALRELRAERGKLRFDALTILPHMLDLLLQSRDLGIYFVQLALRTMNAVARRIVLRAQFLEPAFRLAQPRRLRLDLDGQLVDVACAPLTHGGGLASLQQPDEVLRRM